MLKDYVFTVSLGGASRVVVPQQDDVRLSGKREGSDLFFLIEIEGGIRIGLGDFVWLYAYEQAGECLPFTLTITKPGDITWIDWAGRFYLKDCRWDDFRCFVEIKIDRTTSENKLTDGWAVQKNILAGVPLNEIWLNRTEEDSEFEFLVTEEINETLIADYYKRDQFLWLNPDWPDTRDGWVMVADKVEGIYDGGTNLIESVKRTTQWRREVTTASFTSSDPEPPGGIVPHGWRACHDGYPTSFKYCRPVSPVFAPELSKEYDIPYGSDFPNESPDQPGYDRVYMWLPFREKSMDNAVKLADVLDVLFDGTGLSIKSDFFNINPDAIPFSAPPYSENYHNIFVMQVTDVMRPTADSPAVKSEVSRQEFLEMLKMVFQVYATVDGDTVILEHEVFYQNLLGEDFTTGTFADAMAGRGAYGYDVAKKPSRERILQSGNDSMIRFFQGADLVVSGAGDDCLTDFGSDASFVADRVTNDIGSLYANPGGFDEKNIAFVGTWYDADAEKYFVHAGVYEYQVFDPIYNYGYSGEVLNYFCSPMGAIDCYRYGVRPFSAATLFQNNVSQNAFEDMEVGKRRLFDFTVKYCGTFLPAELVNTLRGWARVETFVHSLKTDTVKISVRSH